MGRVTLSESPKLVDMEKGKSSGEGYKRSGIFRLQIRIFHERLMKRNLYVRKKDQGDLLDKEMVILL